MLVLNIDLTFLWVNQVGISCSDLKKVTGSGWLSMDLDIEKIHNKNQNDAWLSSMT